MPRRDFDDEDDDYTSRRSRRSRYEDEDDDYDDEPRRRKAASSSNNMPMILVLVGVGFVLLLGLAFGAMFAFRAAPAPPPQQFAGGPPVAGPQPVFIPPGVPQGIIPDEVALECTISNLRLEQAGFGGRQVMAFDYEFPGARPIGGDRLIAVVNEPGRPALHVNLINAMNARDRVAVNRIDNGNFMRGTTVYIGKGFGNPKRISNILSLQ